MDEDERAFWVALDGVAANESSEQGKQSRKDNVRRSLFHIVCLK